MRFLKGRKSRQVTPPALGGEEGSVKLLVTKSPAFLFSSANALLKKKAGLRQGTLRIRMGYGGNPGTQCLV